MLVTNRINITGPYNAPIRPIKLRPPKTPKINNAGLRYASFGTRTGRRAVSIFATISMNAPMTNKPCQILPESNSKIPIGQATSEMPTRGINERNIDSKVKNMT